MKKILAFVIVLMVVGLAVVSAQSAETVAEIERLQGELTSGRITPQEFERRVN